MDDQLELQTIDCSRHLVRYKFATIVFATLFLLIGACAAQSPHLVGAVDGVIYCGTSGTPARFATVRLVALQGGPTLSPGASIQTVSNLSGNFSMSNVPVGTYAVDAELPGFISPFEGRSNDEIVHLLGDSGQAGAGAITIINVSVGYVTSVSITLKKGAILSGTVSFDDAAPARKFLVSALFVPGDTTTSSILFNRVLSEVSTDDRGRFRIAGVPEGTYIIKVQLPASNGDGKAVPIFLGNTYNQNSAQRIKVNVSDTIDNLEVVIPLPTN